ncbi:hypothetical protein [Agromyces aureus]|uniref:DUF4190 domain-containing protein n=1 Tax=Agromyces aureus TaxID=453304 RepID=A0A191WED4_9MICO|nr:hypothetical protein [Agromyces aureus]ANJ26631.1 hypothetical protein ATC03_07810 [Agromyces aureus]
MTSEPQRRARLGRNTSRIAIAGVAAAVISMLLPAIPALVVAFVAFVLGLVARRQLRVDPATGPSWVSIVAIVLGAFIFVSQGAIVWFATMSS